MPETLTPPPPGRLNGGPLHQSTFAERLGTYFALLVGGGFPKIFVRCCRRFVLPSHWYWSLQTPDQFWAEPHSVAVLKFS